MSRFSVFYSKFVAEANQGILLVFDSLSIPLILQIHTHPFHPTPWPLSIFTPVCWLSGRPYFARRSVQWLVCSGLLACRGCTACIAVVCVVKCLANLPGLLLSAGLIWSDWVECCVGVSVLQIMVANTASKGDICPIHYFGFHFLCILVSRKTDCQVCSSCKVANWSRPLVI